MQVKLISLTQSYQYPDHSPEELIVYIARVSNPSNQNNFHTSPRLIKYMIENKHWSPFEMVDMTVEIETSVAISRQILRHRSFSFQEFSQRYSQVEDVEPIQLRKGGASNRQSSLEEFDPIYTETNVSASRLVDEHIRNSMSLYGTLIDLGVAKECARGVLPLATRTKLYMKGSIRSWIHYLFVRLDEHSQLEHRQVAQEILPIFMQHFPNIAKALEFDKIEI